MIAKLSHLAFGAALAPIAFGLDLVGTAGIVLSAAFLAPWRGLTIISERLYDVAREQIERGRL
ncbi:hypothetical protein [Methylosinus sp. KRF6]|uniref:hypothetical protein n=1 Tax=Methylosinus sp. KRF6 TaxID=2846853 RepID=UPI001C0E3E0C|nr:hypothetical protein [Methylosinus sp. KRF6]MBU3887118.1 hypothetical protein [Methylosinus sp. KRF6]